MENENFNEKKDYEAFCDEQRIGQTQELIRYFNWCEKQNKRKKLFVSLALIGGFVLGGAVMNVYNRFASYFRASDIYEKVSTVRHVLDTGFLYDYDEEKLADSAALGMVMSVNDPYTTYYSEDEFNTFMADGNGDFVGIGIVVVMDTENNNIKIESIVNGGPAERAGIRAGDILHAVNGEEFLAKDFAQAVAAVRGTGEDGAVGKELKITVLRDKKPVDITVVREKIHNDSVEIKMLEDNIGYLKITGFNTSDGESPDTLEEFKSGLGELQAQGAGRLVIDLRDNGGGDLSIVSGIIDILVPKGAIMYSEDKRGEREYLYSDENEVNMPMVVLVNGNSASASELMTGALRDYEKATVVGTRTYGKGVMQRVYPLSDGSGMTVTVAKYYTPKGICVHGEGITPDFVVEAGEGVEDLQLRKAIEILKD